MLIFPAIDIKDGRCVRLVRGDYGTVSQVADSPLDAARRFVAAGAEWIHMVDLDGAKDKRPVNSGVVLDVARQTGARIEVGGGVRCMETVGDYLEHGVERVILGSAAINDRDFLAEAVEKYGERIAVGIDARNEYVATDGWLDTSSVHYLELAREMETLGVSTIIFTDISRDGTLTGPNHEQLNAINSAVSCNIIASGGISCLDDVARLCDDGLYGAICGTSLYSGSLDLREAIGRAGKRDLSRYFAKGELTPAIVQSASDGEVLMLAYMNEESLRKTLETGYTWFYSRSRQELWNKGATSGHVQRVVDFRYDCDEDTLLLLVEQTGAACHTGNRSCFYRRMKG